MNNIHETESRVKHGNNGLADSLLGHVRTLRLSGRNDEMVAGRERASEALAATVSASASGMTGGFEVLHIPDWSALTEEFRRKRRWAGATRRRAVLLRGGASSVDWREAQSRNDVSLCSARHSVPR